MASLAKIDVEITGNSGKLVKSIKKAETRMQKFKGGATKAFGAVSKAALLGGAAIAGAAIAGINKLVNLGDELDKMSQRTGFAVESLGELKFAAEQSGSSIDTVEKAAKRMASTILDADMGLVSATDALDALGLKADDLKGRKPEEQFNILANALGGVEDASTKAALAQDIFGKSGTELLPLFNQGAEGMDALRQKARDLGIVMSGETAASAADFKDAQNELKTALLGVFLGITKKVLPAFTKFTRFLTKHKKVATVVAGIIAAMAVAVVAVKVATVAWQAAVKIATVAQWAWNVALNANPIGLVIIGVAALVAGIALLVIHIDKVKKVFKVVGDFVLDVYKSKFGWLLPAGPLVKAILFFKDHWETIWNEVKSTTQSVVNGVVGFINSLITAYNKIPFLDDIPTIPSLEFAADAGAKAGIESALKSTEVAQAASDLGEDIKGKANVGAMQGLADGIKSAEVAAATITLATKLEDKVDVAAKTGIKDGVANAPPPGQAVPGRGFLYGGRGGHKRRHRGRGGKDAGAAE